MISYAFTHSIGTFRIFALFMLLINTKYSLSELIKYKDCYKTGNQGNAREKNLRRSERKVKGILQNFLEN